MLPWLVLGGALAGLAWLRSSSASSSTPGAGHVTFSGVGVPVTDSMDGHEIAAALPPHAGSARETALLALAESGQIPTPTVVGVTYSKGGHTIEIFPATDALMLGTVNPVRLNARHGTAQRLADFFGMTLPTSLMSDQAWLASTRISPHDGLSGPAMADTATMVKHSDLVDADLAHTGGADATSGLVRPVGKDWVNTERLLQPDGSVTPAKEDPSSPAAANFGWHSKARGMLRSPGQQPVLQSVGLVHSLQHVDYSQVVTLYGTTCLIDGGVPENIADVLQDPARAFLLSDEVVEGQAARVWRHPSVPLDVGVA